MGAGPPGHRQRRLPSLAAGLPSSGGPLASGGQTHGCLALFPRQCALYFLEGIEVFLQAVDVLLHLRDGGAELGCSREGAAALSGLIKEPSGKLGPGGRQAHRAANIAKREGGDEHSDHRNTSNPLVCHLWLLSGSTAHCRGRFDSNRDWRYEPLLRPYGRNE